MNFKVGDKVICIKDFIRPSNVGKVGKIINISYHEDSKHGRVVRVKFDDNERQLWEYTEIQELTKLHKAML